MQVLHSCWEGQWTKSVTWPGDRYNPLVEGDSFALSIIKKVASDSRFRHDGVNQVTLVF